MAAMDNAGSGIGILLAVIPIVAVVPMVARYSAKIGARLGRIAARLEKFEGLQKALARIKGCRLPHQQLHGENKSPDQDVYHIQDRQALSFIKDKLLI